MTELLAHATINTLWGGLLGIAIVLIVGVVFGWRDE